MKPKIIIADDDPGVQDIFKIIFEKAGFHTTVFSSGETIMKNDYELPDVFLLDKQLSGSDGLDICRHLKSNSKTKDIPVIMVSATPHLGKLSKQAGADDFVEKPFSMHDLVDKVNAAVQKKALAH